MAGKWFPADQAALKRELERAFQTANVRAGGAPGRKQLVAFIAPHAAIQYSGVVAASVYRSLGKPRNVIILGFSHSRAVAGVVAPKLTAYQTPLGTASIDADVIRELGFRTVPEDEVCDHSLENQLPFVQFAVPQASLTPLYVGEMPAEERVSAGRKLAERIRKGDVVIASSDLTHYGKIYGYTPFPGDEKLPSKLAEQTMRSLEEIGSTVVPEFDAYLQKTGDTICGREPIRLLMEALRQLETGVYPQLLDYITSGDLTRDNLTSVGYGALAFYPAAAFRVDEADQEKLLASARSTLERYFSGERQPVSVPPAERSADVQQRSGVFVTIRRKGQLRGCVGTLATRRPLWEVVPDRTVAASASDPRFRPLSRKEGPVSLEISVLTPLRKVKSWQSFRLGLGAVLLLGDHAATLLPQVAQETGWNRQRFLENLSLKAGLGPNAYRDAKARLYVFEAQVFAERDSTAVDGRTQ